ncbi:replication-relaxation family protein [Actinospica robiniae]|uniref:replication-relaxation family protein n=1 Tax=Actinospica robiniae TaxID=304901 RepID=UPI0003F5E283|nr:replication-relaxation family protein [Actinospica robiniae]
MSAAKTTASASRYPGPSDGIAYLYFRTTPRDRWLLAMLAEHRLLTAAQIQALCFTGTRTMNMRLAQLRQLGLVDRFRSLAGALQDGQCYRYVLGPRGAVLVAAAQDLAPKEFGYDHAKLMRQGARADLRHTIGARDALVALAARGRLAAWWDEYRCLPVWGDLVRPDAYGVYEADVTEPFGFFYEYDTGSERLPQLTAKTRGYARYAAAYGGHRPILFHLPDPEREQALHRQLVADPDTRRLPIVTVTATLAERSPAQIVELGSHLDGHVWQIVGTSVRCRLTDLPAHFQKSGIALLDPATADLGARSPVPRAPRMTTVKT